MPLNTPGWTSDSPKSGSDTDTEPLALSAAAVLPSLTAALASPTVAPSLVPTNVTVTVCTADPPAPSLMVTS